MPKDRSPVAAPARGAPQACAKRRQPRANRAHRSGHARWAAQPGVASAPWSTSRSRRASIPRRVPGDMCRSGCVRRDTRRRSRRPSSDTAGAANGGRGGARWPAAPSVRPAGPQTRPVTKYRPRRPIAIAWRFLPRSRWKEGSSGALSSCHRHSLTLFDRSSMPLAHSRAADSAPHAVRAAQAIPRASAARGAQKVPMGVSLPTAQILRRAAGVASRAPPARPAARRQRGLPRGPLAIAARDRVSRGRPSPAPQPARWLTRGDHALGSAVGVRIVCSQSAAGVHSCPVEVCDRQSPAAYVQSKDYFRRWQRS